MSKLGTLEDSKSKIGPICEIFEIEIYVFSKFWPNFLLSNCDSLWANKLSFMITVPGSAFLN